MFRFRKKKRPKKVGGFAFFSSYLVLAILAISNMRVLTPLFLSARTSITLLVATGLIFGWWAAYTFFRGQTSVLIHEYKHAILSTLVGNKWKKIKLDGMSGKFHYTYTKDTAEYNAFISLAPYFLPIFTFVAVLTSLAVQSWSMEGALVFVSAFHGAELYFNWKDANPIQTDLTDIRGGFFVAFGYVLFINIVITSTLLVWLLGGVDGLEALLSSLWILGLFLTAMVRSALIPLS